MSLIDSQNNHQNNSRNMSVNNKAYTTGGPGGFNKTFNDNSIGGSASRRPELDRILDPALRANSHHNQNWVFDSIS